MTTFRAPRLARTLSRCVIGAALVATSACSAGFKGAHWGSRMPGEAKRAQSQQATAANSEAGAPTIAPGFSEDEQLRIALVQPIVEREAKAHGLEPALVNAVIWVESRFRPEAKSPAGARGLMQLMPATAAHLAKQLGERRPKAHDPDFNIRAGAYYLSRLLERFDGDETLAIAAYNAGPGNVAKWQANGKPLPDYSRDYVAKVNEARARFDQHGQSATVAPPMNKENGDKGEKAEPIAPSDVVLVQADTDAAAPAPEPAAVPEPMPDPTFDTPVFEPAPELDAEVDPSQRAPAHPVAVRSTRGQWPLRHAPQPATANSGTATPKAATGQAATGDAAPTVDETTNPNLPAPPELPEVGAGVLPDIGPTPASAP